jgi:tetratricopeptide (TPR) repeat protein
MFLNRLLLAAVVVLLWSAETPSVDERLARHRNLGKAFYENPTTQAEAVVEFRRALELAPKSPREKLNYGLALLRAGKNDEAVAALKDVQRTDPKLPHTWFNLGIAYKKAGDIADAIGQFEHMSTLTPDEPIVHYQLGALYKMDARLEEARKQFELAAKLNPNLAAPQFQLYNILRQGGQAEDAQKHLDRFKSLKKNAEGAAVAEDVDWCTYAEIYDPPVMPTVTAETSPPSFQDRALEGAVDATTAGFAAIDSTGTGQTDLLVWSSKGVALYRRGTERVNQPELAGLTGVIFVAPGDFDNDGLMDLCVLTEAGPVLYRNVKGRFQKVEMNLPRRRFDRAVWIDYDHDYDLDLVLLGENPALMRNEGAAGFADRSSDFPFAPGAVTDAFELRTVPDSKAFDLAAFYHDGTAVLYRDQLGGQYGKTAYSGKPRDVSVLEADFDGDGRADRVRVAADGVLHFMRNQTRSPHRWIKIQLAGIKSLKLAQTSEVEIKAGAMYQKQTYTGVPLLFDAGAYTEVDTVRITWSNGLIQNETKQATNRAYVYKEAQRLSGSCPMIWTWNGRKFEFITDVLGVAPLGASDGEGTFFPVDHDEYVQIPGESLKAVNGKYEIRVTEELSEVSYLDQLRLYAIDHPADEEIFTNDKFKSPPFPEFRLFGVKRRVYPYAAHDDKGRDVLGQLVARDHKYPDEFVRGETGVAESHLLDLDFGKSAPSGHAVLLLNGWVDWADGSTFRAAAQEHKGGLVFPYLQVKDVSGNWKTVNADMGIPSGKPKTIAVDVKFLSASREIRIVTNLCVYWDEIFLSEETWPAEVRQRMASMTSAELRFRGFSESKIHPERKQPETFFYESVSSTSFWNPTPGLYTRYGDVRGLLESVDDRMAIMGSGDEIRVLFGADALPALPRGWRRDFLLKVDGWAKDRDPNTAFSTTVEPLPFHAMSGYPYPGNEHYPSDGAHAQYRREYNTRPALRLIRPLAEGN